MDPTMASISSVFGLLATFFQERRGCEESQAQATLQEYIEWLNRGRHTELVELLKSNQGLMTATEQFMHTGQQEILDRFDQLEEVLAQALISTPGWREITLSLNPKAKLSDQAAAILLWHDASGVSKAIMSQDRGNHFLVAMGSSADYFRPKEPRFFEADLDTLVFLGLLIEGFGSSSPNYTITREAVSLAQSFGESSEDESIIID